MTTTLAQTPHPVIENYGLTQPTPMRFFETMNAYQRTAVMKAAIDLDLFTAIAEGRSTVQELVHRIGAPERGIRALCDFLVVMGFMGKYLDDDEETYNLTSDSEMFLNRNSPAYVGSATKFMGSPEFTDAFKDLAAVIRAGGPLPGRRKIDDENPLWIDFARYMAPLLYPLAEKTAALLKLPTKAKVLDISASHGLFGIHVVRQNPGAHIVALDYSSVLAVTKKNVDQAGLSDHYSFLAGDALQLPFETGFDAVLVPNLLHHWDPATIEVLLRKIHAALVPGGHIVIVEFVPNEDRVTPPPAAAFVMNMLATTMGGGVYTFSEFSEMLAHSGFAECELYPLPPFPHTAIVAVKE